MRVYVDESYNRDWFFLWMTILSKNARKKLNKKVIQIKEKYNISTYELKYSKCKWNNKLKASKEIIDAFFESTWCFKAIAIHKSSDRFILKAFQENEKQWNGDIHDSMQKTLMNQLIRHSCRHIHQWLLYLDEWKMWKHISDLSRIHTMQNKTFSLIEEIDSKKELMLQVNDLLLWSIYAYNVPPANKYKRELSKYVMKKSNKHQNITYSLGQDYWNQFDWRTQLEDNHPQFNIWYFKPKKENLQTKKAIS